MAEQFVMRPEVQPDRREDVLHRVALLLLLLTAFSGPAFLAFPVGPISLFPYRILLFGVGGVVLAQHVRAVRLSGRPRVALPTVLVVTAVAYAAATLAWTPDLSAGVRHLALLSAGLVTILIVADLARTGASLRGMAVAWLFGVGLLLLLAFYEHVTGQHVSHSTFHGTQDWRFLHVPTATFVNPNDLAALLALSMPFATAVFQFGQRTWLRWTGFGLAILIFYIIHATQSRAALLAVLCEGVVLLALLLRKARRRPEQIHKGWILLAALGAVVLIAQVSPLIHVPRDPTVTLPPSGQLDSIATRVNLARNGWEALKSTYGLGVGVGGWQSWFETSAVFDTEGIVQHHNWWLEIGTTLGLPFLLAYIAVYLGTLWRCWRARLRAGSDMEKMLTEAALLGLVGFSFASLGPSTLLGFSPQWLFWGFAVAVLAWSRGRRLRGELV